LEMRERLKQEKRLPSLMEMLSSIAPDYSELKKAASSMPKAPQEKFDRKPIEDAFTKTAHVLFGVSLKGIDNYAHLLSKNSSLKMEDAESCLSGAPIKIAHYASFQTFPKNRLLTQPEADFAGEQLKLSENELNSLNFANLPQFISKIAYFSPFWLAGTLKNNIDTPLNLEAVDCYKGVLYIKSKLCGYCFSPRSCDYTFGSNEGRHLSFTINCNFSIKLTRCFECDSCENCSDLYFSHNCENVHDSMFCFNVKNLRYAIGNAEVGREKYPEIKKLVLGEIARKIGESGDLEADIYNTGHDLPITL